MVPATVQGREMKLLLEDGHNAAVIHMVGTIDIHSLLGLKEAIATVLRNGSRRIVVNLHGVNGIDMVGAAGLLCAARMVKERRGDLLISCASTKIKKTLRDLSSGDLLSFARK